MTLVTYYSGYSLQPKGDIYNDCKSNMVSSAYCSAITGSLILLKSGVVVWCWQLVPFFVRHLLSR